MHIVLFLPTLLTNSVKSPCNVIHDSVIVISASLVIIIIIIISSFACSQNRIAAITNIWASTDLQRVAQ